MPRNQSMRANCWICCCNCCGLSLSLGGTLWPLAAGHSSQVWQFNPHQNPKHKRSSEMRRLRARICCMRGKSDSKTSDSPVTTNT